MRNANGNAPTNKAQGAADAFPVATQIGGLLNRTRGGATGLPPYFDYDFLRVAGVLAVGGDLWAAHYDDVPLQHHTPHAAMVRENTPAGERMAAGGLLLPHRGAGDDAAGEEGEGGEDAVLTWLAADAEAGAELAQVLESMEAAARDVPSVRRMVTSRDAFGAGWPGLPTQPVVNAALAAAGWTTTGTWQVFAAEGVAGDRPTLSPGVRVDMQIENALIAHYLAITPDEQTVSECDIWALPDAISGATLLLPIEWMTVEYVGTQSDYRRRGLARMLIGAAMWAGAQQGIRNWLLWAEPDNAPMIALAQSIGFAPAFTTQNWEKALG